MTVVATPHLRRLGWVMTVASLTLIASVTLIPQKGVANGSHLCLVCGSLGSVDALLNVLLFVPLGIALSFIGLSRKQTLIAVCALSLLIETAQYLAIPGRYSTVGDVVMNTLGGVLGFAFAQHSRLWLHPPRRVAKNLALGWSVIWLVVQAISNYGLAVTLPRPQYYGQIARTLRDLVPFHGTVVEVGVGGVPTPNTAVEDAQALRLALLNGAQVTATVVASEPADGIAAIFRVVDARGQEITLVAQMADKMVFGVRTGAEVLRLRPLYFALPHAFSNTQAASRVGQDTLWLSGRYLEDEVNMKARGATDIEARFVVTAAFGWTFWLPFQWFVEGTRAELLAGFLWTFGLAVPLGYWLFQLYPTGRSTETPTHRRSVILAAIGVLVIGLILVPYVLGTSPAPFRDWTASLTGLLAGIALGPREKLIRKAPQPGGA